MSWFICWCFLSWDHLVPCPLAGPWGDAHNLRAVPSSQNETRMSRVLQPFSRMDSACAVHVQTISIWITNHIHAYSIHSKNRYEVPRFTCWGTTCLWSCWILKPRNFLTQETFNCSNMLHSLVTFCTYSYRLCISLYLGNNWRSCAKERSLNRTAMGWTYLDRSSLQAQVIRHQWCDPTLRLLLLIVLCTANPLLSTSKEV